MDEGRGSPVRGLQGGERQAGAGAGAVQFQGIRSSGEMPGCVFLSGGKRRRRLVRTVGTKRVASPPPGPPSAGRAVRFAREWASGPRDRPTSRLRTDDDAFSQGPWCGSCRRATGTKALLTGRQDLEWARLSGRSVGVEAEVPAAGGGARVAARVRPPRLGVEAGGRGLAAGPVPPRAFALPVGVEAEVLLPGCGARVVAAGRSYRLRRAVFVPSTIAVAVRASVFVSVCRRRGRAGIRVRFPLPWPWPCRYPFGYRLRGSICIRPCLRMPGEGADRRGGGEPKERPGRRRATGPGGWLPGLAPGVDRSEHRAPGRGATARPEGVGAPGQHFL